MRQRDWLLLKCAQLVSALPHEAKEILRLLSRFPECGATEHAALITFICSMHRSSLKTDDIASFIHSRRGAAHSVEPNKIAINLVLPASQLFYARRMPFDIWWDIELIYANMLTFYLEERIQKAGGIDELRAEVADFWTPGSFDLADAAIKRVANLAEVRVPPLDTVIKHGLLARRKIHRFMHQLLPALPSIFSERSDLRQALRAVIALPMAVEKANSLDTSARMSAMGIINGYEKSVNDFLRRLMPLERVWFQRLDDYSRMLDRCLHHMKRLYLAQDIEPLPDTINGEHTVPSWIKTCVFGMGARAMHHSVGPMPYFFIVIEEHDRILTDRIGLHIPEFENNSILLRVAMYDEVDGEQLLAPITYSLDSNLHLAEIALLLATESIRIDVFRIHPERGLDRLCSVTIDVDEQILSPFRAHTQDRIRQLIESTDNGIDRVIIEDMATVDPVYGFLICELAKSELLFVELDELNLEDTGADEVHRTTIELISAKQTMLALLAHQAELIDSGATTEASELNAPVATYARDVNRLRQHLRGIRRQDTPASEIEDLRTATSLAGALESERRCFLHLEIRDGYMDAYWIISRSGRVESGRIDLSRVNVSMILTHAARFLDAHDSWSAQAALEDTIRCFGPAFCDPIVQTMKSKGVEYLVLSPVGVLDSLPIHCAMDSKSQLLCDIFDRVSYAPSARVLEQLVKRGPVHLGNIAAFAFHGGDEDVQNVDSEVDLLCRLFAQIKVYREADASLANVFAESSRTSIVHIAGHGKAHLAYPYSAGIRLSHAPDLGGYLSVARVLERGDFQDTGLVVLSACEGGQSAGSASFVQTHTGLDSAFLARGARSVVSAMWKVHDLVALIFVASFYDSIVSGAPIDLACIRAANVIRTGFDSMSDGCKGILDAVCPLWRQDVESSSYDFSRPYFWASFKSSGYTWARSSSEE